MIVSSNKVPKGKKAIKRRGLMLILSSPSGAGKSTISRILREDPEMNLALSVSVTTRQKRLSEVDGVHYHFISVKEFEQLRQNNELAEWAEVHGNYYATLRESVEKVLLSGNDMLFDIDYQGAAQLQEKMPDDVASIFILPPSMKELMARLHRRAEDTEEVIQLRLQNAHKEIAHWSTYNYVLINEDLEASVKSVKSIILAERLKRSRFVGMKNFINSLMKEKI